MKLKMSFVLFCFAVVIVAGYVIGFAAERDATKYVGTKNCRMCHKKEETGNQYEKWLAGPHSKTFELLGTPEARTIAAGLGIKDPQKSGKCLKCHSSAYNFTEEVQTAVIPHEDGVSCESCHGPGKGYKSKKTMEDRQKSIEAGMIYPATESCTLCHNDLSPTWKTDRYVTKDGKKVGFDAGQAYETIKHPNLKKEKVQSEDK